MKFKIDSRADVTVINEADYLEAQDGPLVTPSVSHRLLERFQLTAITLRKMIALTSGFHHQIVHSFGYLETNIHIRSITRIFVTS